ncbi:MAG: mechanosensitive ion channel [Cyanobacteria bacterium P01_G01_bin.4]
MLFNIQPPIAAIDPVFLKPPLVFAQAGPIGQFFNEISSQLGDFLPSLLGAIAIFIAGFILANILASAVKRLIASTDWDEQVYAKLAGKSLEERPETDKYAALIVFWTTLILFALAALSILNITTISAPVGVVLSQALKVGALALVAWLVATACKLIVVRVSTAAQLDNKLAETTQSEGDSPFPVGESLGTALYWLVWVLFLPLILDVLSLDVSSVDNLFDQLLSALPNIIKAASILGVGWLAATIVRMVISNFLKSAGADSLGTRMGLPDTEEGLKLSDLAGLVLFALILALAATAALEALAIDAISRPAIAAIEQFTTALPQVLTAAGVLAVLFFIGRIIANIVTSLLTGLGFDNILSWLGLSSIQSPALSASTEGDESQESSSAPLAAQSPSELVGTFVLVLIMLGAAVTAANILNLEDVSEIVTSILRVLTTRILVGVLIFGFGLYFANIASSFLSAGDSRQGRILAQVAKIAIIIMVSAMALQQVGVAETIVIRAFTLLLGAFAVAVAIAFGWGGRDIAAEKLRRWWDEFDRQS